MEQLPNCTGFQNIRIDLLRGVPKLIYTKQKMMRSITAYKQVRNSFSNMLSSHFHIFFLDIYLDISNKKTATLLATETRYQYIRCVAPSYRNNELCLAVGLANGKVGLCNFVPSTENNIEFSKSF